MRGLVLTIILKLCDREVSFEYYVDVIPTLAEQSIYVDQR